MNPLLFEYNKHRNTNTDYPIINHEVAFSYWGWIIRNALKGQVLMINKESKGRHQLFHTDKGNFYVLFKHEDFNSFNHYFKEFVKNNPKYSGHAESINVEYLKIAMKNDAWIVYIKPDGNILIQHPKDIATFCQEHNLIREQQRANEYKKANYTTHSEIINERTYCIPLKFLKGFFDWYKEDFMEEFE